MNLYHTRGDGAIGRKKTKQELRDEREQERIRHYQKQRTIEMEAKKIDRIASTGNDHRESK